MIIANQELAFQNKEKAIRADELIIANQELAFQNKEKAKRADELIIANQELLVVKEDITLLLTAKQEIKLKNEELSKLNAEKDKFFAIIAHDLRGPLGGFMGLTEMMADKEQHFEAADIKEMTVKLSQAARQTFNLLKNLLESSKLEMDSTTTVRKNWS